MSTLLLYILAFFTPLISGYITVELFEFPKTHFVYLVGSLFSVCTVLAYRRWPAVWTKSLLSIGATLFVTSNVVSTILSRYPNTALWGYYSRFNGGLIATIVFFGIFLAFRLLLNITDKEVLQRRLLYMIAAGSVPIAVLAVLQHFGHGGSWAVDTTVRAFSTFGQPNWYAAYVSMIMPLLVYLAMETKVKTLKYVFFALAIVNFFGFWYAYSLSGLLGLAAATIGLLGLNTPLIRPNLKFLLPSTIICVAFAVLNPGIFGPKVVDFITELTIAPKSAVTTAPTNQPKEIKPGSQTYQVSDSGFIRKKIWQGTIAISTSSVKNLLVGTGPETFPYVFQNYRPKELNYSSEWNYILNKPHNYYLELLAQNGIIGLALYLILVLNTILVKHRVFTPSLIGLYVTNLFGWPTISTTLLFWLFLALLEVNTTNTQAPKTNPITTKVFVAVGIFIVILISTIGAKNFAADVYAKSSIKAFEAGDPAKALQLASAAITLNTREQYYYRLRAKALLVYAVQFDNLKLQELKKLVYADLVKAQELNAENPANSRGLIPLYYLLAITNLTIDTQAGTVDYNSDDYYKGLAQNYFRQVLNMYPNDVGVATELAKYQKLLGLQDDYGKSVEQIKTLRPDLLEWYLK